MAGRRSEKADFLLGVAEVGVAAEAADDVVTTPSWEEEEDRMPETMEDTEREESFLSIVEELEAAILHSLRRSENDLTLLI